MDYKNFFTRYVSYTKSCLFKKMKDSNTTKISFANPHYRQINLSGVDSTMMKSMISFEKEEHVGNEEYYILSMKRLNELLPIEAIMKVHASTDMSFVAPWLVVSTEIGVIFKGGKKTSVPKGKLAIPLQNFENSTLVFLPCGGLDDNDNVPGWVEDFDPTTFFMPPAPQLYFKRNGLGTITVDKTEIEIIEFPLHQDLEDGDFIKVRNVFYSVKGFCQSYANKKNYSVRVNERLERNANFAPYSLIKPPVIKGNVVVLSNEILDVYRPVKLSLKKKDSNGFGQMIVEFQNACFNMFGFMTHDTAI